MASDIITEAKKRFERAKDYYSNSRVLAIADTRFAWGDSDNGWQWPDDVSQQRLSAQRVRLTINTTAQHCNQVINEIRQNRPACKVSAVDNGADKKTADILGGLIRNIQASSNADDAHDVAAEHAVYGGEGYWRIKTEYESETSFDQIIKVCPLVNPNLVYVDIDAKELDRSDAEWGFIFEEYSIERFKRECPDIDPSSWIEGRNSWVLDKETFLRAEYFWCEYKKDTACLYRNMEGEELAILKSDTEAIQKAENNGYMQALGKNRGPRERSTMVKQWKHCIIVGGHNEPLDETDWLGAYLPIVSIVGKEIDINGQVIRKGLVRDLKDPARTVNYAYSETVQTLAMQNKIPYIAAAEAIEGYATQWQGANNSNDAYLPYNAYDANGNALPRPSRQEPAVMPAAQIQLLELSLGQMRGASGQQNANFGIKSEAQSGIGIQRLKVQGEMATFHFPDNLARGLKYEAKILIDLIQKIYTTAKVIRILGIDGKPDKARLDPNMEQAYSENRNEVNAVEKIFNPTVGQYDVTIDTGPSFQSQRQESAAVMTELARSDPSLMQRAGDLIVRSLDFQDGEKLAERLEKTLPPGLLEDKGGPEAQVAKLTQQIQMMEQESQQHIEAGQQLEAENAQLKENQDVKMMEIQAKQKQAQADAELERDKAMAQIQLEREKAEAQIELDRQKAVAQAELAIEKIQMEVQAKAQALQLERDAEQSLRLEEEALSELEEPVKKRKTITIQAPSGAQYVGSIEEE